MNFFKNHKVRNHKVRKIKCVIYFVFTFMLIFLIHVLVLLSFEKKIMGMNYITWCTLHNVSAIPTLRSRFGVIGKTNILKILAEIVWLWYLGNKIKFHII